MTKTTTKAPFRADHVGSLLRPERLHEARSAFKEGTISADQLREVENDEIKKIVDKQIEAGLQAVTDGEFRRTFFHLDFMEHLNGFEGYIPEHGYAFKGEESEKRNVRNTGTISFNPDHPFLQDVNDLIDIVDGQAEVKFTIPSPNMFFNDGIRNPEIYPDLETYAEDIIHTYQDAVQAFYDAGLRYLQFDDVYIAGLGSDNVPWNEDPGEARDYRIDLAVRVLNESLAKKPDDLTVTVHLCRGNYRSTWAFEGGYDRIAPKLFAKGNVDGFFLEYDDERSGGFTPLKYIPENGPRVVLGVVTSKLGELEDKHDVVERVKRASKIVPLEQLCLSPQCGFASTHHGNELTEDQQWAKLKFIADVAKDVWGEQTL
ncbi:5-methyltetrahydropteroyltriglutamate--homocysteine S-methyltransferase [Lentibacillus salicampi]|uniref:5-methyltetrahydropteroyltriglutamate--homocysteine S-methyltransferase n=1 Tax=Lentibacillus salicampi TaxID=175306 RepID=A0A4Y9A7M7_9BACI|nr:5-methyltetrahydropteroyltriglutamate--homocysteine S-methyltransferase [Lentibacillus salicampi]TFJ91766.1 5-methyltetrahydropteroyltriglutamate--homocysteine S-methyltransferase [Lentibacillus salicampi]